MWSPKVSRPRREPFDQNTGLLILLPPPTRTPPARCVQPSYQEAKGLCEGTIATHRFPHWSSKQTEPHILSRHPCSQHKRPVCLVAFIFDSFAICRSNLEASLTCDAKYDTTINMQSENLEMNRTVDSTIVRRHPS